MYPEFSPQAGAFFNMHWIDRLITFLHIQLFIAINTLFSNHIFHKYLIL